MTFAMWAAVITQKFKVTTILFTNNYSFKHSHNVYLIVATFKIIF